MCDFVQDAVYERRRVFRRVFFRNFERLVDDDRRGDVRPEKEFTCRSPEDVPVDNRHSPDDPVFRGFPDGFIDDGEVFMGGLHDSGGEFLYFILFIISFPELAEYSVAYFHTGEVKLKENLQGVLSCSSTFHDTAGHREQGVGSRG